MDLLRDYYQGTPYDMTHGLGAGPFQAPVRWDSPIKNIQGGWERPFSMYRTLFSFVLQSRHHLLPDEESFHDQRDHFTRDIIVVF